MARLDYRKAARLADEYGFIVDEGACYGTCDDVAGTWYINNRGSGLLDRRGRGYGTKAQAYLAILDYIEEIKRDEEHFAALVD